MAPPEAPVAGENAPAAETPPAVPFRVERLRKRTDFLAAARARRASTPGFTLQARPRAEGEPGPGAIRVGFTCSRKVGNAVARNRAKRRLREAARHTLPHHGRPGWDYVLIGRPEATAARPFDAMLADLEGALARVHLSGR
jgi:ribonuclease P protein component